MSTNYKGSIVSKLFTAVENNPEMTMGEILYSFLHKDNLKGQHFFYVSDKELYNSLEEFTKIGVDAEEPINSQEFEFWIKGKNFSTK